MENKPTSAIVKGVIISLILIVFGLVIYFTDQMQNRALGFAQYLILFAGIIWADVNYAKQMNGNVTFGNVFSHGFKTTAVIIVIMALYTILSIKVIFPDMVDKAMEQARSSMEEGKMPEEQIEKGIEFTRNYFLPLALGGIILMFGLFGAIASLIGAAVAKKNPNGPFTQQP